MKVRRADVDDAADLARLLLAFSPTDSDRGNGFDVDLRMWLVEHRASHVPFLAFVDGGPVGMAWLVIAARVPRPGVMTRTSGDLQSVFVLPEHRNRGIGGGLVAAACEYADAHGTEHLTVHSTSSARSLYRRAGFIDVPEMLYRERP